METTVQKCWAQKFYILYSVLSGDLLACFHHRERKQVNQIWHFLNISPVLFCNRATLFLKYFIKFPRKVKVHTRCQQVKKFFVMESNNLEYN